MTENPSFRPIRWAVDLLGGARRLARLAALLVPASAMAGVIVNENATWPTAPALETFFRSDVNVEQERDVRFTRHLTQTFQLREPSRIDKIYVSYEQGLPGKEITVRLFSVADVNAPTLIHPNDPAFTGTVYFNFVYTTTDAISQVEGNQNPTANIEFDLTETDEPTVPGASGTAGYALQIMRTGVGSDVDNSTEMAFKWHWNDNDNLYRGGRGYALTGGTIDANDDFLIAIVSPDEFGPTVVDARSNSSLDRLTIVYSDTVDVATATELANYSISGGLALSNPELVSPTTVRFTTSPQTAGAPYTVTINNVRDDAGNAIVANTQATFNAFSQVTGFVNARFFRNILPRDTTVDSLIFWPAFTANAPDEVRALANFTTPANYADDYGVAVSGVLVPRESGDYHFFVRSDDNSRLYLNLNGPGIPDPAIELAIAEEVDCCDPFMEPELFDPATTVNPVSLVAGQRYGILFLVKEGGGGDFGQVAWRKVGDPTLAANLRPMSGELFETFVDTTGATLDITSDPVSTDATEGGSATFTVAVTTSVPPDSVGYQWMRNGTEIAGATSATYVHYPVLDADQGANFTVRVRVPGLTQTSDPAVITSVAQDTVVPTVLSADPSDDHLSVAVLFSEDINPASVSLANISVTPELTLSNPQVTGSTLRITTTAQTVGTSYTLTLSGITDWAGNVIAANSQVTFLPLGPRIQGESGFVIWEAEDYDRLVASASARWRFNETAGTPSGRGSMEHPQGLGASEYGDHLEYDILFTEAGRHFILVRGGAERGDPGGADSVWLHVYPAGTAATRPATRTGGTDAGLTGFSAGNPTTSFVWGRDSQGDPDPMDFFIPEPGLYTIGIGTREDGAFVDKFIITRTPVPNNFNVTGTVLGPPVTLRQGEPLPPPADITITTQPVSRTVMQNTSATFTVVATSTDPAIGYQWQRKVGDTFVDLPPAQDRVVSNPAAPSFTINPATIAWDNAVLRVLVSVNGRTVASDEVTLDVIIDETPPTVVMARGRSDLITMTIIYSERMDTARIIDPANYTSALGLVDPVLINDRMVQFTTSPQTVGTEYVVTINNVTDSVGNAIAPNTQVRFFAVGMLQQRDDGYVVWEAEDFDRMVGTRWLFNPTEGDPSAGASMYNLPTGGDGEYTHHMEYDIVFTQTGRHFLWIRGGAERGNPGGADSVWVHVYPVGTAAVRPDNRLGTTEAAITGFGAGSPTGTFVWANDANAGPDPYDFYIAEPGVYTIGIGIREDGAYADKFLIATNPTFTPAGLGPNETPRQGEPAPAPSDLEITAQPASQTVLENRPVSFTVGAVSTDPFLTIQWQRKVGDVFEDIPGATGFTLDLGPATSAMNGTIYRARISVTGRVEFSNEATLTVQEDTTAPTALSAGAFVGGFTVGLRFDEPLDAGTLGTYRVNGAPVVSAIVHANQYVRLTLDNALPNAANHTVTFSGATDTAGNASAERSMTIQMVGDLLSQDIGTAGDPVELGDAITWGTGFWVAGGGSDIWGAADHGFMVFKQFTGAFDMRARIDHLQGGDEWGKASLMARETLDAGSRNQMVLITKPAPFVAPTTGGMGVYNHQYRDATDGTTASTADALRIRPTVFPSWIRLVRASATSNQIDSYVSYDGETWVALDSHVTPDPLLPETLHLGMMVTSHDNAVGFPRAEAIYEAFSIQSIGGPFNPNLGIAKDQSGAFVISWTSGRLVSSDAVDGAYQPVDGATSPYTIPPGTTTRFYQVVTP